MITAPAAFSHSAPCCQSFSISGAMPSSRTLERLDFVYCHVEAPDEAGHLGSSEEKVRAIERVDGMLGTIMDRFDGIIAVLPDHATPIRLRTHTREPVPVAVRGLGTDNTRRFSEREAEKGDLGRLEATALLPLLLGRS